jgi:hypothetical protein
MHSIIIIIIIIIKLPDQAIASTPLDAQHVTRARLNLNIICSITEF